MDNLEKIFTKLPRTKLRRLVALRIKLKLYKLIWVSYWDKIFIASGESLLWRRSLAIALLVLLILGGTSVYAYASPGVIPGSPIYPLKIAVENIEKAVSVTPASKAVVYEKISSRRLQEAADLSNNQAAATTTLDLKVSHDIESSIEAAINNHQNAVKVLEDLDNQKNAESVRVQTQTKTEERSEYLHRIEDYAQSNQDFQVLNKVTEAGQLINRFWQDDENDKDDKYKKSEEADDSQNGNWKNSNEKTEETISATTSSTTTIEIPLKLPEPGNILPAIIPDNSNRQADDENERQDNQGDGWKNDNQESERSGGSRSDWRLLIKGGNQD